jgi:hypothetical protein
MRIDLLLTAVLVGAAGATSCSCPPAATTPSGSSGGSPAPAPAPAPEPTPPAGGGERTAAVASSHAQYQRVEGTSFQNACSRDDQCAVGGCSSEVCSAEQGVSSTCEAPADGWPTTGASCGCVQGQCIWYRTGGEGGNEGGQGKDEGGQGKGEGGQGGAGGGSAGSLPAQGATCGDDGKCAKGLTCVKYYGFAGPKGPEFKSCEIPCAGGKACPSGQQCVTVADGPGQVCRAAK